MKIKIIYLILTLFLPLQGIASKALNDADQAYLEGNYSQAIRLYESYLSQEVKNAIHSTSPELSDCYYNLGNCYYRSKDWGHAVLYYQRALRVNPQNDDAAFNLELTQAKLKDQFDTPSEMFFLSWTSSLIHSKNATQWGQWGFSFLIVTIVLLLLYFVSHRIVIRKIGLYGGLLMLLFVLLFHSFAWSQYRTFNEQEYLVVLDDIHTYEAPSNTGKQLQALHEGTTLQILETISGTTTASEIWYNVQLPNGSIAWIPNAHVEKVADLIPTVQVNP